MHWCLQRVLALVDALVLAEYFALVDALVCFADALVLAGGTYTY